MAPPQVADGALERDSVRAIVIETRHAAIDLARRKDEAAPLGEGDHLLHQLVASHRQCRWLLPTRPRPLRGQGRPPHTVGRARATVRGAPSFGAGMLATSG